MSEYKHQLNVKLGDRTFNELNFVSEFEDIKPGELVRNWIREKLAEYRQKDRLFQRWVEKRQEI